MPSKVRYLLWNTRGEFGRANGRVPRFLRDKTRELHYDGFTFVSPKGFDLLPTWKKVIAWFEFCKAKASSCGKLAIIRETGKNGNVKKYLLSKGHMLRSVRPRTVGLSYSSVALRQMQQAWAEATSRQPATQTTPATTTNVSQDYLGSSAVRYADDVSPQPSGSFENLFRGGGWEVYRGR